jgi:hypothetical protein
MLASTLRLRPLLLPLKPMFRGTSVRLNGKIGLEIRPSLSEKRMVTLTGSGQEVRHTISLECHIVKCQVLLMIT